MPALVAAGAVFGEEFVSCAGAVGVAGEGEDFGVVHNFRSTTPARFDPSSTGTVKTLSRAAQQIR